MSTKTERARGTGSSARRSRLARPEIPLTRLVVQRASLPVATIVGTVDAL